MPFFCFLLMEYVRNENCDKKLTCTKKPVTPDRFSKVNLIPVLHSSESGINIYMKNTLFLSNGKNRWHSNQFLVFP